MPEFELPANNTQAEAAVWIARLRADDRTVEDEANFHRWLEANARNAVIFDEMNTVWDGAGSVRRDLRTGKAYTEEHWDRRRLFWGIGAVVGLGATAGLVTAGQAKVYQTEVGEQKHVVLDDGTRAFLDTDTKLQARFGFGRREAELQYGRASFTTASGPKRPFTVKVDQETITSRHSTFDISRDDDQVSVVLIQGNAVVEAMDTGVSRKHELASGQQLLITSRGSLKLESPSLLQLLAWHNGQALFENNSLSEAVYEMNRYSLIKLQIVDDRIANMRISGVYPVGDNAIFSDSLRKLLPIKLTRVGNRIELVRDDFRPTQG